jgi:hypothetical protein
VADEAKKQTGYCRCFAPGNGEKDERIIAKSLIDGVPDGNTGNPELS